MWKAHCAADAIGSADAMADVSVNTDQADPLKKLDLTLPSLPLTKITAVLPEAAIVGRPVVSPLRLIQAPNTPVDGFEIVYTALSTPVTATRIVPGESMVIAGAFVA